MTIYVCPLCSDRSPDMVHHISVVHVMSEDEARQVLLGDEDDWMRT